MKTRKDSNSKLANVCEIKIPFSGSILRVERKPTMTNLIRVLLGLIVALTFLGNIVFILETRNMNREGEQAVNGDLGKGRRDSIPRLRDGAGKAASERKAPMATPGRDYMYAFQGVSLSHPYMKDLVAETDLM